MTSRRINSFYVIGGAAAGRAEECIARLPAGACHPGDGNGQSTESNDHTRAKSWRNEPVANSRAVIIASACKQCVAAGA